ncbi:C2 calcium-dependent domain-containing protein 4C-like [Haliotis rubra]|uniref:C2 calcium-dependent domain-containing protein 4C-like n=1 Tax=Haliotis rubra TaxID=36100 RepID=UPI001EE5869A|nr:C2 calcium-dependent domain-containing protein 4C-like [Haliotis rubra]XP_046584865.1 C2 calcium-dependent domain-containing protein 4C-like [Haliotis rubra]XP_046584866.1 C2 calcium-dependent domain-containing protein 4C-like [Haliotis rubra]
MTSIKDIKDWLINKCRIPNIHVQVPLSPPGKESLGSFGSIVTPQTIPEFVIPGSNDSSRHPSIGTISNDDELFSHSSENSLPCSAQTSPGVSPRGSFSGLGVPTSKSPVHIRSAPVSPRHESKRIAEAFGARSLSNIVYVDVNTNADPQSKAAMSLSHFKTNTSYGFTTLKEVPHTRRKESLFHTGDLSSLHFMPVIGFRKAASLDHTTGPTFQDLKRNSVDHSIRPTVVNFACVDEDNLPRRESSRRSLKYYRRRSSLPGLAEQSKSSDGMDDSNEDSSSNENIPTCQSKGTTYLSPKDRSTAKRHSSPDFSPTTTHHPFFNDGQARSSSVNSLIVPGSSFPLKQKPVFGELKFAFHYLPDTRQLKVLLIRGENLGGHHRLDCHLNVFAKLYLMPGKVQKQTSEITKHSKDPVFNEEIFFNDQSFEVLQKMTLRIKLYNKGHLKPNEYLGELNMALGKFDLFQENRMWRDIEPKREGEEDLGHLQVTLQIDAQQKQLKVTIGQATRLPHHQITGPPDPYVRVELSQPGEEPTRLQTRVRRKTSHPVFKEALTFDICSVRPDVLRCMSVCVTVLDHDRIRSDSVIGQVRFGCDATEDSEILHWREITQNMGCGVIRWHYIMESAEEYY